MKETLLLQKHFDTKDVLAAATGKIFVPLQDIFTVIRFMAGGKLDPLRDDIGGIVAVCKAELTEMLKRTANVDVGSFNEIFEEPRSKETRRTWSEIVDEWVQQQGEVLGKQIPVAPLLAEKYAHLKGLSRQQTPQRAASL